MNSILDDALLSRLDQRLRRTDDLLQQSYPGDDGRRQPVHTVYVPAEKYTPGLPAAWGREARDALEAHGGLNQLVAGVVARQNPAASSDEAYLNRLAELVAHKLEHQPIEDLRLDFEDGYGRRRDSEEDSHAVASARAVAAALRADVAPPFIGLRFKCLEADTRARGLRTLELYLSTLLESAGHLPDSTVITLPKVTTVDQISAMNEVVSTLESGLGLKEGALRYEVQVETPQLILGPDGAAEVARALHAGQGRISSLHYGTYDYSASLGISAAYQSMDHPAADFAKMVMQAAAAGTGVHLSDGSTNILPVGSDDQVHQAWELHSGLVFRHLRRGIYQGWDMHPGHLPTRFLATFDFFLQSLEPALARLGRYLRAEAGAVMDEPATAKALARYVLRGSACGAVDPETVAQRVGVEWSTLEHLAATGVAEPNGHKENA